MPNSDTITEELPGIAPGGEPLNPLDIPPFLRRADEAVERIMQAEAAVPEQPAEPTVEQVLALIKKMSDKQTDLERKKNELKNELINRIWQL